MTWNYTELEFGTDLNRVGADLQPGGTMSQAGTAWYRFVAVETVGMIRNSFVPSAWYRLGTELK